MNEPLEADEVIHMLSLAPLPDEGGMYKEIWTTEAGSAIYFLARPDDFSSMHRLNRTELWHHYAGAPLQLILLDPDGSVRRPILGDNLVAGHRPLAVVDAGVWMGGYPLGPWTLAGTTMAPPFDAEGFELARPSELLATHPAAADEIKRLTRGGA